MKLFVALIACLALTSAVKMNPFTVIAEERIALLSVHGTYVRAPGGEGSKIETSRVLTDREKYRLQYLAGGSVALKTWQGYYVRANPGLSARVEVSTTLGDLETFQFLPYNDGTASFKTFSGTFLAANPGDDGTNVKTQDNQYAWGRFTLLKLGN